MKVLYVTSEVVPFVKTGGLADVAGSLPAALNEKRAFTRVMLPLYESIGEEWRAKMKFKKHIYIDLSWRKLYCGVFELKHDGITYYFLDNEYYFKRPAAYGFFDDGERFAFFCRAVVEVTAQLDWKPDVIHVNDWQSAFVPVYMKELEEIYPALKDIRTLLTIHNIEYQGRFSAETLHDVFGLSPGWYEDGTIRHGNSICMMKGGILTSDYVTTVSPTYAEELKYPYFAQGMEGALGISEHRFRGVLNGIDMASYNPETDTAIYKNFSEETFELKAENKRELQHVLGLEENPDVPVIACVGRLVSHKGMDLVMSAFEQFMGLGVQFVLLGTGDYKYEQFFRASKNYYEGRFSANIAFSEPIARRIYAGADMFLMPSQKEPCGLSQMISMRYGTVPIVRETGGLRDTVIPYGTDGERGFTFENYSADDMIGAVSMAVNAYNNEKERFIAMAKRDMGIDFGWGPSALAYKEIYMAISGKK